MCRDDGGCTLRICGTACGRRQVADKRGLICSDRPGDHVDCYRRDTPARRRRRGVVGFRKGSVSDQRVATHVLFGSSRADVSTSSFGSLPRLASNAVISFQTRIRSWTTVADQQCRVLGSLTTHSFCSSDLPRGAVGAVTAKKVCRLNNVASPR